MVELLEGIGHNIHRLRAEKGWNQTELGFRAGTSPSIISLIENGKRNPSTATLAKIAGALGVEVVELFPKASSHSSREPTLLNGLDDEWRESRLPEAAVHGPYRWIQDKTTEELQQIALEEAQFAKPQTYEELLKGHKENKKAQLEEAHRRTMAYANIANINEELNRRGARSPVELAIKQFNDAMSAPEEAPQETREKQEDQRAG
jgi:transcriptional regulator with XRE-family HTH domain